MTNVDFTTKCGIGFRVWITLHLPKVCIAGAFSKDDAK